MKITKFRLISERPEETTFLVKKIKKRTIFTEEHIVSDDQGNQLSVRDPNGKKFSVSTKETEGIVAYSLPSHTRAHVEILETEDGLNGDVDKAVQEMQQSTGAEEIEQPKRPGLVNLTQALDPDRGRRAMVIPKSDGIQWADKE